MTYAFERDELRQELRKDVAGTVRFWPKRPGIGNVAVTSSSYIVYKPDGTVLEASQAGTDTDVGGIDRIDCAVAAIDELGEGYYVDISWIYSSVTYRDIVQFDVVLWPYGEMTISLNDLQEERPDIGDILTAHGAYMGSATSAVMASVYGYRARVELDSMIRAQIIRDREERGRDFVSAGIKTERYSRPNLILNRERLNRVERKLALMLIYRADSVNPEEGADESAALYRAYKADAASAWASVGPLSYDNNEDVIKDETVLDVGRAYFVDRIQG